MKQIILIIIVLLLSKPVLPVIDYIVNYDYIVKELCENKEKPQLACNGKCHLMKELAKASENEKPLSQKKAAVAEAEVLFLQQPLLFLFAQPHARSKSENTSTYCNLYSHIKADSIFHPPVI